MWTKYEENKLIDLYPNMLNIEIGVLLNKTKSSVDGKAHHLGLKKSPEFLRKVSYIGNSTRIANGGRNLTFDILKGIASNYKTRIDFIRGDGPAYQAARHKGILDDICKHMTVMKFSIPQLILREILDTIFEVKGSYNNRKVIKPYEIDIYYKEFNLGFEYQGLAWHLNNKNDVIKSKMLKDLGVNLIYIHEYNGSRNYENDIKKQLINNLKLINKLTNKQITKKDIMNCKIKNIYLELYNKEELIQIVRNYNTFNEFKLKECSIHRKLCKMKLIDEATSHMTDKKIHKLNYLDKDITNIVNKYNNLTDFRRNELRLYKHIKRVGKDYLLTNLKRKEAFSINDIKNKINEYVNKSDFIKNNEKMYKYIRVNKLTHMLKNNKINLML
jgi:hypothetical protein